VNLLFLNSADSWGGNEKWVSMAMTALAPAHGVHLAYRGEAVGRHIALPKTRLPFLAPVDPYTVWRLSKIIRDVGISVLIPTKPADIIAAGIAGRLRGVPTLARLGIVTPSSSTRGSSSRSCGTGATRAPSGSTSSAMASTSARWTRRGESRDSPARRRRGAGPSPARLA